MARRKRRNRGGKPSSSSLGSIVPVSLASSVSKHTLTITLKSDLCPGSGDGFSSGIDSDICYDSLGIPTIPGRRIKGCLREAAEAICNDQDLINLTFGKPGSGIGGAIVVSDASMAEAKGYDNLQMTLDHYCYTRAQTKVDPTSGTAQENTLRFVRVVRHYRTDGSESRFEAPICVNKTDLDECKSKQVEQLLFDASLALRNIGLGRNRGFGAVRCQLNKSHTSTTMSSEYLNVSDAGNERVVMSYRIHLDAPVMLSQQSGTRSASYIPGSSVFGFLARKLSANDSFEQLFFGDNLYCSSLYPIDEEGNRCLPASPFVIKVKGGSHDGQLINAQDYKRRAQKEPDAWGTPKPLRDGFVSSITWQPVEVNTQTLFHHSTGSEGTLYTQTCINEGQDFAGYVECTKPYAGAVAGALLDGRLTFGRSKSAQYATCSLVKSPKNYAHLTETLPIIKGHTYALVLETDALIGSDNATYASDFDTLEGVLRQTLADVCDVPQLFEHCDARRGEEYPITNVQTKLITGYNAKWNQKRPHARAYAAGSCIVFEAQTACKKAPTAFRVGDRQPEGFGQIRVIDISKVKPRTTRPLVLPTMDGTAEILRLSTISFAESHMNTLCALPYTASLVGRISLMIRESSNEDAFLNRIASIKDKEKREATQRICNELLYELAKRSPSEQLTWTKRRECLEMLFRLAKYYLKQKTGEEAKNAK